MSNTELIDKFIQLLEDFQEEHQNEAKVIIYCGKEYTQGDFKSIKKALENCKTYYTNGIKASDKYNKLNRDLYNARANYYYYKRKKNKTERDFRCMERARKKVDRYLNEKAAERKEEMLEEKRRLQQEHGHLVDLEQAYGKFCDIMDFKDTMKKMGEFEDD